MNNITIGIDLGTTYSCVGIFKNGRVEIITNSEGSRTTPSYVAFTEAGDRLIGDPAKSQSGANPYNTIYDAKRLIGKSFSDKTIQNDMKHWPFKVIQGENDKPLIGFLENGEEKFITPEEISSMVLTKMKQTAEAFLDHEVHNAVITVPAYFNDSQRRATMDAGKIAGLNVQRIINEPTAAAMAYGLDRQGDRNVLVFDLGGGTLDCSILNIDNGLFTVKSTCGDCHLGGQDFDNRLVIWVIKEFKRMNKDIDIIPLMKNRKILSKIKTQCERAKKVLSLANTTNIEIEALYEGIDFQAQLTRAKFENLCFDEFQKCMEVVKQVLSDADYRKENIDDVVLVGGSTRVPRVRQLLQEYFGKEPKKDINPDEAIAYGAAVQGAILSNVNDDVIKTITLIDVTALSLGIEVSGGIMSKIVTRNSEIPCTREQIFSTYTDNQPVVSIKVFEGEREFTKYNNLLGVFDLVGIPPMPRGIPKIIVKFKLDVNGILSVSATEESTGKTERVTIKNDKNRFTSEQLEQMIKTAQKYGEKDKEYRDKLEARNTLENYLYSVRNSTLLDEDTKGRLGEEKCKIITEIINKGVQWLDNEQNKVEYCSKTNYTDKQKEIEDKVGPIMLSIY